MIVVRPTKATVEQNGDTIQIVKQNIYARTGGRSCERVAERFQT